MSGELARARYLLTSRVSRFLFFKHDKFQSPGVQSVYYELIRENSELKIDLVDSCYIISEVYNIVKNQFESFVDKIIIDDYYFTNILLK